MSKKDIIIILVSVVVISVFMIWAMQWGIQKSNDTLKKFDSINSNRENFIRKSDSLLLRMDMDSLIRSEKKRLIKEH
ncbi:MAG TPA: hypothetical protein VIM65_14720 [Cyclobacteriaceae bacterium]